MSRPLLELKGLAKRFGGVVAIDRIDFSIEPRDVLAIVGPNGAGKTTLFHLISGHMAPDAGEIYFQGSKITQLSTEERVCFGISRTFQKTKLFYGLTVEQNVQLGCFLKERGGLKRILLGAPRSEQKMLSERITQILKLTGLMRFRHYLASQLSYGYQRRLEIANALGSNPQLLLLDEPFGGLSPQSIEEIGLLIRRLNSEGITIIFIEHRMESVVAYCNRLFVMQGGSLILPTQPLESSHAKRS
jgi:branched-chain amino acid transport system ATP-binding protein